MLEVWRELLHRAGGRTLVARGDAKENRVARDVRRVVDERREQERGEPWIAVAHELERTDDEEARLVAQLLRDAAAKTACCSFWRNFGSRAMSVAAQR